MGFTFESSALLDWMIQSLGYGGLDHSVYRTTNPAISELKEGGVFQIYEIFIIITTREMVYVLMHERYNLL